MLTTQTQVAIPLGTRMLIEDVVIVATEKPKLDKPVGAKGIKLGDVEGVRARLDKRLGSDELLKVYNPCHVF